MARKPNSERPPAGNRSDDPTACIGRGGIGPTFRVLPGVTTWATADGRGSGEGGKARLLAGFGGRSVIGLLGLVLGALALAGLLYALSGAVLAVDHGVAGALNAVVAPHPGFVTVLQRLSVLGASVTSWLVLGTLALYLLLRGQGRLAAFVAVSQVGAAVLVPAVKELVGRVRPIVDVPVAAAPGPSFPSGHTLSATVLIGVLLLALLPAAPPAARRPLLGLGAVLVVVVGFTRIALGVHFLSDVVGGAALGLGWLAVTASAFRTWRRQEGLTVPPVERGLAPEAAPALAPAPDPEPTSAAPWTVLAQLLVSAVLLLAAVVGLGLLLARVLPGTVVDRADLWIVQRIVAHRTPTLDELSGPAADLGSTWVVFGGGLVAAVLAVAVWRCWRPALLLAAALLGELAIFLTAATVVGRPRPVVDHLDAALPPTSSFPSGHTGAAICLYGAVAALILTAVRRWWRWLVVALAVAVVVAVALARLYRGAHFPTDVLGSVLFALPWLIVTLRLLPPTDRVSSAAAATRLPSSDRAPAGHRGDPA